MSVKAVTVDVGSLLYSRIIESFGHPENAIKQMTENLIEYNVFGKLTRVWVYQLPTGETILLQNFSMSQEQQNAFFNFTYKTTATTDNRNGRGEGARISTIANTKDNKLHAFIKRNGKFIYGWIGTKIFDHVKRTASLVYSIDEIAPEKWRYLQEAMKDNSTIFIYDFVQKDYTKRAEIETIREHVDMAMEEGLLEVHDGNTGEKILTKMQERGLVDKEVVPNVFKELTTWQKETILYLKGTNSEVKIKSESSEPKLSITEDSGRANFVRLYTSGCSSSTAMRTRIRAPVYVRLNWNFLDNFCDASKIIDESNPRIEKLIETLEKVINDAYGGDEPEVLEDDENIKMLEKMANEIFCPQTGPTSMDGKNYRYVCKECGHTQYFTLKCNPSIQEPTPEEKSKMFCGNCKSNQLEYKPIEPGTQPEPTCPVCGNTDITKTPVKYQHKIQHICNVCGNNWTTEMRSDRNSGIQINKIKSTKLAHFVPEEKLLELGVDSAYYRKYLEKGDHKIWKLSLAPWIVTYAYYLNESEKTDVGHRLWAIKELELERLEKSLL